MPPTAPQTSRATKGKQKTATGRPTAKKAAAADRTRISKPVKEPKKVERKAVTKAVKETPRKNVNAKELKVVPVKKMKETPPKEIRGSVRDVDKKKLERTLQPKLSKDKTAAPKLQKPMHVEKEKPVVKEVQKPVKEAEQKVRAKQTEPSPMLKPVAASKPPVAMQVAEDLPQPKKRGRRKKSEIEDMVGPHMLDSKPPSRGKRGAARRIVDDFLVSEPLMEDDLIAPDELDPLELPLELLDPELIDITRPSAPHSPSKPKAHKGERRLQKCALCGGMFGWLSVDQHCFSCLKRAIAKRKRDDESYSDYASDHDHDDDES
jgi:hypothetical protein